jgi:hypothetical protein
MAEVGKTFGSCCEELKDALEGGDSRDSMEASFWRSLMPEIKYCDISELTEDERWRLASEVEVRNAARAGR